MNKEAKIFIAGHRGMVGSALLRNLEQKGFENIVLRTRKELDLCRQEEVETFFRNERPDYVFLAAAKVGGINANNNYRADFIYDNIMIEANVIKASSDHNVQKLLFLGSSCIYPKLASQPLKEEYLLSGALEQTNEPYAIAKIAGIKLSESFRRQYGKDFISVMPTNLYGKNDNYDLKNSHVLPALIRKFHEAKINALPSVEVWGTGSPMREFLHVDDLAEACVFLMENYSEESIVNVGTGKDISIKDLAEMIKSIVGYNGDLVFNHDYPDGTPRKLLDVSKLRSLGWAHKIELEEGVKMVYEDFKRSVSITQ